MFGTSMMGNSQGVDAVTPSMGPQANARGSVS